MIQLVPFLIDCPRSPGEILACLLLIETLNTQMGLPDTTIQFLWSLMLPVIWSQSHLSHWSLQPPNTTNICQCLVLLTSWVFSYNLHKLHTSQANSGISVC